MQRASLCIVLALIAFTPGAAQACSMAPGYKVPTTLELAAPSDTIVIATITEARQAEDFSDNVVIATPTTLLKGVTLPARVEIVGAVLADDAHSARMVVASAPRELRKPNPGALIGGCVRYIFDRDMKLVLFLKRDSKGELIPIRSAFSRDAEDVAGPDALWVKAVREYAAIGEAPTREWKARLVSRATALRESGDTDSLAIARDMDVERKGTRLPSYD